MDWIYLTDGGHLENLGSYQLLREQHQLLAQDYDFKKQQIESNPALKKELLPKIKQRTKELKAQKIEETPKEDRKSVKLSANVKTKIKEQAIEEVLHEAVLKYLEVTLYNTFLIE
jgi:hypothetical protein